MNDNNLTLANMPEILNAEQIAEYLHISYVIALHTIKFGGIPHKRIGNQYRVPKRMFEAWLTKVV